MFDLPPVELVKSPELWLPSRPAVIRPVGPRLFQPQFLPATRAERRVAVRELLARRVITPKQAQRAIFLTPAIGWSTASPPPVLTFQSPRSSDTADATNYTFTSVAIGTASADRLVVVVAQSRAGSVSRQITGLTIGGVAATSVVNANRQNSNTINAAIFTLLVTSGTTATIVLQHAGSTNWGAVTVYTITGLDSTTAVDFGSASGSSATESTTVDVSAGGIVIAGYTGNSNATTTWTGVTEDVDTAIETRLCSAASSSEMSAETGRTIQAVASAGTDYALAAASFR